MQLFCDLVTGCHCVKELVRSILWVTGHKPKQKITRYCVQSYQQIRKINRGVTTLNVEKIEDVDKVAEALKNAN